MIFKKNKKPESSLNIDKDALKAGENILKDIEKKIEEERVQYPLDIQLEFVNIKKEKELKEYLIGIADKSFRSPKVSKFYAIKYDSGYIYELQEGGSGKGYLTEILKRLEKNEDVVLLLDSGRKVRIIKDGIKIKTITLTEDDKSIVSNIEPKDKLTDLFLPGTTFLFTSLSITLIGLISITLAMFFKYVLLNESELIIYPLNQEKSPYIASLDKQMEVKPLEKIEKMEYTDKKGWKYSKKVQEVK